ncbi:hypothetical protein F5X99DRAFT_408304 [Biscogniauxia marginata]|nr:hypothetical protein F5X99DRAFT_408304 [Biscogniauxia marginata]
MENISDQIIYGGCWAILFLYVATTLLVFVRRSCVGYAASFLFACALWLDLTLFNLWFLLPAFYYHLRDDIDFHRGGGGGDDVVVSSSGSGSALGDLGLMALGWFASSLSISNSLSMWEVESDCDAARTHDCHRGLTGCIIRLATRAKEYVGIEEEDGEEGIASSQIDDDDGERQMVNAPRRKSILFAFPRYAHKYIPLPRRASPSPLDGVDSPTRHVVDEKAAVRYQEPDGVV